MDKDKKIDHSFPVSVEELPDYLKSLTGKKRLAILEELKRYLNQGDYKEIQERLEKKVPEVTRDIIYSVFRGASYSDLFGPPVIREAIQLILTREEEIQGLADQARELFADQFPVPASAGTSS